MVAREQGGVQHRIVLRAHACCRPRTVGLVGQGRDTDRLTGRDPVTGLGTFAVDADLAGAQQFFEAAMAERRVVALEQAAEPCGSVPVPDLYGIDPAY